MIVLNGTLEVLRVVTTAAVALDVSASYVDNTATSFAPGNPAPLVISTATTTTIVAAPGASTQRGIKHVSLVARGGANTLTVEVYNGTTAARAFVSVALATGEALLYEDGCGWRVFTAIGEVKGVGATGPTGATGPSANPTQSHIGWAPTAAAQTSNLLTVLAAGHAAGLYLVAISQLVKTISASAIGQETVAWSNGGAQSLSTGNTGTTGLRWSNLGIATNGSGQAPAQFSRVIWTDGVSAMTVQVTAAGTVATPVVDVYASACRVGT